MPPLPLPTPPADSRGTRAALIFALTAERRQLSALSDGLARQIAGSLSREAGLYTTHEMMEALDPNYDSELARSMMDECARLLDAD